MKLYQKKFFALNNKAMTLPELLVALFILILAVTGILLSFLRALELQEVSQAFSAGTKAAMSKLDHIRSRSTISADVVIGSDGNYYKCKQKHTAVEANRPVDGASYTDYWTRDDSVAQAGQWVASTYYLPGGFDSIKNIYNGTPFDVPGLTGKGSCYVDDTNADLLLVAISISWKQKNGRIYGGDKNFNGQLDTGETAHAVYTSLPNSPLVFVTRIFKR